MTDNRENLARALADSFEQRTRDNGETFYCLTDNAPEWMREAMRDAHGDMLPDDTRYRMIRSAVYSLTDYSPDDWEDCLHEMADSLVDVYTADLTAWLASHIQRVSYCDEAASEYGLESNDGARFDTAQFLMRGQYAEYIEILSALVSAITEQAEESETVEG